MSGSTLRALSLASLTLLAVSCDLAGDEGGPGPGPGVSGDPVPLTGLPTVLRASQVGIQLESNSYSYEPSVSADGRFVAFYSEASNLVPGDTNFTGDIFVRDRQVSGTGPFDLPGNVNTVRVSVATDGSQNNSYCYNPVISADGRYVSFISYADNLAPGDTNGFSDVFVHDRDFDGNGTFDELNIADDPMTGPDETFVGNVTVRVSVATDGTEGNGYADTATISADGRYVVFSSGANNLDQVTPDTNNTYDIFLHDRDVDGPNTGLNPDEAGNISTTRISMGPGPVESDNYSFVPTFSGDARFIVFYTYANNLVPGDSNGTVDVVAYDRDPNVDGFDNGDSALALMSVNTAGIQANSYSFMYGPAVSQTGRYVSYYSYASNLDSILPDTNNQSDAFVHDRDVSDNGVFDEPGDIATIRVSVDTNGNQGNSTSYYANLSADGRIVAFISYADNLTSGDTNGASDIFVRDRCVSGVGAFDVPGNVATFRVSVRTGGTQCSGYSWTANPSADGSTVVFYSSAPDLVASDTNGTDDCFAHSLVGGGGVTVRVSEGASTEPSGTSLNPSISRDGRYVVFDSDAGDIVAGDNNGQRDIFLRDVETGTNARISISNSGLEANGPSAVGALSADGRFVSFSSAATNLHPDDADATIDVFLRAISSTKLISRASGPAGVKGNGHSVQSSVSGDGRLVAFQTLATNLIGALDTNAVSDIYVRDVANSLTVRVSVDSAGAQANGGSFNPKFSADGTRVVFQSLASNLNGVAGDTNGVSDIYVRDLGTSTTIRVSVDSLGAGGTGASINPSISADGRFVVFETTSALDPADANGVADIYIRDIFGGTTTRVSPDSDGVCTRPSVSDDGRFVTFQSTATDLVTGDTNGVSDIFMVDLAVPTIIRVSADASGNQGLDLSQNAAISGNGSFTVFESAAKNLVTPAEGNNFTDIYRVGPP